MQQRLALFFLLSPSLLCLSCSSGGAPTGSSPIGFQVTNISVRDNSIWEINRPIEFVFTEAVDFSTVSNNSIRIHTPTGEPATGVFSMPNAMTIVYQPNCPRRADLADAGLRPDGQEYFLTVLGLTSGESNSVRSTNGRPLQTTQRRNFRTPDSFQASEVFQDTVLGPPRPKLDDPASPGREGSYLELGGDSETRVYFHALAGVVEPVNANFASDLNLYSDTASGVALVIEFNQPVNPAAENISSERIQLQYRDASGGWVDMQTRVELVRNCSGEGAAVRVQPVGVFPSDSRVRANLSDGFEDLAQNRTLSDQTGFVSWPTKRIEFTSLPDPDRLADGFVEGFEQDLFLDPEALFVTPPAEWRGGKLKAGFAFEGDGGPGGAFDWVIEGLVRLDTTTSTIIDEAMTFQQTVVNGVVNVRNFEVRPGGRLDIIGPNPARIRATGDVIIEGLIDISGNRPADVDSPKTANQPEPGALGNGGGGRGGTASQLTTNSTLRALEGDGAFRLRRAGGEGGESAYSPVSSVTRRPGGGGGGRFQQDEVLADGEEAHVGGPGHMNGTGAVSMNGPAAGGRPGPSIFSDDDLTNNFWGLMPIVDADGRLIDIVRGELNRLYAGSGGGGGGDAIPRSSPVSNNWGPGSDQKGGAGGGGGGGIHIQALGRIVFGELGLIRSNGGPGARGEQDPSNSNSIGACGGSGSGGHIVLESATQIDFSGNGVVGDLRNHIEALGALGTRRFSSGSDPVAQGGRGGGGVIQLHVPDPLGGVGTDADAAIRVPTVALGVEDPLDELSSPRPFVLIPTFGPRSQARSRWIPIAGADQNAANGSTNLVRFRFGGTDADGLVRVQGDSVQENAPLLSGTLGDFAFIDSSGSTLVLERSSLGELFVSQDGLSNDFYLRTTALFEGFLLRLETSAVGGVSRDFLISRAEYDEGNALLPDERLFLHTMLDGGDLLADLEAQGATNYRLIPRFFRAVTEDLPDLIPTGSSVRILFEATGANALGQPDTDNILITETPDISLFNGLNAGDLRFFRFQVEFQLVEPGQPLTPDAKAIGLDFLKVPFVF